MSENNTDPVQLRDLTTGIVAAYVAHNPVPAGHLPQLIGEVHGALARLASGAAAPADDEPELPTAAEIRKSITPDGLISFIDGKPYKTLKRHLTKHGLEPASYRKRFGLPHDYPTTSANYSAQRSSLAKQLGLGQRPPSEPEPAPAKAGKRPVRQAAE